VGPKTNSVPTGSGASAHFSYGRITRWLAVLSIALVAGCTLLDTEQARVCRLALPALHPDGTAIREVKIASPASRSVRIDYEASEPENRILVRRHWVTCGFAGSPLTQQRLALVSVDTDRGPMTETHLLYLNRFWIGGFGVAAEEPNTGRDVSVRNVPQAVAYAAQQVINATPLAATYALLATAYALIYGLIGRLNLAFGQLAAVGAYGAVGALTTLGVLGFENPLGGLALALVIGAALACVWSWAVGMIVVAPLHARYREGQPILVATIATAIAIEEILRLSQGARDRWLPPLFNEPVALLRADAFVVTITPMQIAVAFVALAAAAGVLTLLARSRFGREWRAFADDPGAAALFGVGGSRLFAMTFGLSGLLCGLAGWIVGVYYGNVSFAMGAALGLKALVAAVVGGIGSVPGAFIGGLLVGLVEIGWSAYFDIAFRDVVVFSLLIVMFVLRPGGLFGLARLGPRQV
jgi:branched-chain amino acid transport system permease protein